jgi:MFS family permease
MFFIPIPYFTKTEGADIVLFFSLPVSFIMGILIFSSDAISSLYAVNQPPVIQEINLPEAQGQIVSWNQFLENIGYGLGPLIAGIFISAFGQNYQVSAIIITVFVIPGTILWLLSVSWYPQDKKRIKEILKERAEILKVRKESKQEL